MGLKRIENAFPLPGFALRLTLTDGSVIERDVASLLNGPVFDQIRNDPACFGRVEMLELMRLASPRLVGRLLHRFVPRWVVRSANRLAPMRATALSIARRYAKISWTACVSWA